MRAVTAAQLPSYVSELSDAVEYLYHPGEKTLYCISAYDCDWIWLTYKCSATDCPPLSFSTFGAPKWYHYAILVGLGIGAGYLLSKAIVPQRYAISYWGRKAR